MAPGTSAIVRPGEARSTQSRQEKLVDGVSDLLITHCRAETAASKRKWNSHHQVAWDVTT